MRYFFGFLAAIGLIVLVFILILKGFSGGGTPKNQLNLSSLAQNSDTMMRLTIDGPINADQKHVGVRVTVSAAETQMEAYHGYQNNVTNQKTYGNNQDAYNNFLHALQLAGFTRGSTDPKRADERGYCPLGNRYVFEVVHGADDQQRFWSSSCGQGNFGGKTSLVLTLFRQQVPDYDTVAAGLSL